MLDHAQHPDALPKDAQGFIDPSTFNPSGATTGGPLFGSRRTSRYYGYQNVTTLGTGATSLSHIYQATPDPADQGTALGDPNAPNYPDYSLVGPVAQEFEYEGSIAGYPRVIRASASENTYDILNQGVRNWYFAEVLAPDNTVSHIDVIKPRGYLRRYELDSNGRIVGFIQSNDPNSGATFYPQAGPHSWDAIPRPATYGFYEYKFVRDNSCAGCGRILEVHEPADITLGESSPQFMVPPDGTQTHFVYDADWNLTRLEVRPATKTDLSSSADWQIWYWEYNSDSQVTLRAEPHAIAGLGFYDGGTPGDPSDDSVYLDPSLVDNDYVYSTTYQESSGQVTATTSTLAGGIRNEPTRWVQVYDERGRMVRRENPAAGLDASIPQVEEWEYYPDDPAQLNPGEEHYQSLVKSYTSAMDSGAGAGIRTDFIYDADGRVIQGTLAAGTGEEELHVQVWNSEGQITLWRGPPHGPQNQTHEIQNFYNRDGLLSKTRYRYYADPNSVSYAWVESDFLYTDRNEHRLTQWDVEPGSGVLPANNARASKVYGYNADGDVYIEITPDGVVSKVMYDEARHPVIVCDAVQAAQPLTAYATRYRYSSDGKLEQQTEDASDSANVIQFGYDELDRLVEIGTDSSVHQSGPTAAYDYASEELDKLGRKTRVVNIVDGSVLEEVLFEYDDWHNSPTKSTRIGRSSAGVALAPIETLISYAHSGAVDSVSVAGREYAKYEYTSWGALSKVGDSNGNQTEYSYDSLKHRLAWKETTSTTPNAGPLITKREYGRDLIGMVTSVTFKAPGEPDIVQNFEYDTGGCVVARVDGAGIRSETRRGYDGRVLEELGNVGGGSNATHFHYTYTPSGRVASLEDNRSNVVHWSYDARMRLVGETVPAPFGSNPTSSQGWSYGYYHNANLLESISTPSGRFVAFEYNQRLLVDKRMLYADATKSVLLDATEYAYSPSGHVDYVTRSDYTGASVVSKSVSLVRDSRGHVEAETATGRPTLTYGRNALGRLTSTTVPGSYTHTFVRDEYSRVEKVFTGNLSGTGTLMVSDARYLGPGGNIAQVSQANSLLTTTVQRNGFGLITDIECSVAGTATPFLDFECQWNERWLLDFEKRGHEAGSGDVFAYDALGRLQEFYKGSHDPSAQVVGGSPAYEYKNTYHMDADYHRTVVERQNYGGPALQEIYTTDPTRHHYDSIGVGGIAYVRVQDADGNIIQEGDRYFIYDAFDRLTRIEDRPAGSVTDIVAEYEYDAIGRRELIKSGGRTIECLYSGPFILEERDVTDPANEFLLATHFRLGVGLDDISMSRRLDISDLDEDGDSTDYVDLYHHQDRLGSVIALTLEDGSVVESYGYDAYGAPEILDHNGVLVADQVAPSGNRFLFTGREFDAAAGLYDYRARSYDPATGTFLQEDPLGLVDSVNPIAYVWANPAVFNDPTGMYSAEEALEDLGDWLDDNRDILGQLLALTPLGDLADLISAASGKDVTGWLENGFEGGMQDLGWWERSKRAAFAAPAILTGAFSILGKIDKIKDMARVMRGKVKCKVTGKGCFAYGTLIVMSGGTTKPIEDVELGDGLEVASIARNAVIPEEPDDLVRVVLLLVNAEGLPIRAQLLRKRQWVNTIGVGRSLVAEGFDGVVTQVATSTAPDVLWAPGLVTGLFTIEYRGPLVGLLGSDTSSVWATPNHPVYDTRGCQWSPAMEMSERAHRYIEGSVYNLEVLGAKSYVVRGETCDVVAHNQCPKVGADELDDLRDGADPFQKMPKGDNGSANGRARAMGDEAGVSRDDLHDIIDGEKRFSDGNGQMSSEQLRGVIDGAL